MDLPPSEICKELIALHARLGESDGADHLNALLKLLADNALSWSDWPELFALHGLTSSQSERLGRWVRGVHEMIGRASTPGERWKARDELIRRLAQESLDWAKDLPGILGAEWLKKNPASKSSATTSQAPTDAPTVNALKLVLALIEDHMAITPEQRIAAALWVLHTYLFDRYSITPRLALLSPVRRCGKTTLIVLLEQLCANSFRSDGVSPAAIYYQLDERPLTTFLIDEGDNLDLFRNALLRRIFNSGHRRGGNESRFIAGRVRRYPTFAPLAVAAIGTLPLPLMDRSIVINMQRASTEAQLRRFDEHDPALTAARAEIQRWAATSSLNQDPPMPASLRNRAADNWRVLIAIADNLGYGEAARATAIALGGVDRSDEDPAVVLLRDIRTVFETLGVDRISVDALVAALIELDNSWWAEWTGRRDDRPPHKLTRGEMLQLLRPFRIRAKTVWPLNRQPGDKSFRGFLRDWFEPAWTSYCSDTDTSTQASKIVSLPRP
jgi:hypothetical protein